MKIVYFQGLGKQWYWRLVAKNNHIIATGGEGYASRRNVERAVNRFRSLMQCQALPVERATEAGGNAEVSGLSAGPHC